MPHAPACVDKTILRPQRIASNPHAPACVDKTLEKHEKKQG